MQAPLPTRETSEDPVSEDTRIQPKSSPRCIPVEQIEYHLFRPQRAHDPLLDAAYELWRDVWRSTWQEANAARDVYSDDFTRQEEVGVLAAGKCCIAVTGLRWLDLTRARWREDSYFKTWPEHAAQRVTSRFVCVASNTAIHPLWRGALIEPGHASNGSIRLAFATIALSAQRFLASPAEAMVALTRNDRSIDRIASALGATTLAQLEICGNDTSVMCIDRADAVKPGPVVHELWERRHQG
jgi:hypothetical protein